MPDKIGVFLVDDISSTVENLEKLLSFEDDIEVIGSAANGRIAVDEVKRVRPNVVLMDVNMPEMDGIQATELIASEAGSSPVIIMSVQGERDYLRRAMQAGAREFLIKPFSSDELVASIRRVHQLEQRKEAYAGGPEAAVEAPERPRPAAEGEVATDGVAELERPEAPPAAAVPARVIFGELIVLFSGKGGVGKSVLACNLACSIAKETGARVALIDLDLQFGDIGVLLNLPQTQSITDLVENIDGLDYDFVNDVMPTGPAGIRVLTTPPSPELADLVTDVHVQKILGELRNMFDFIIVDTSSHLGDVTLTALDMASRVVLVTALSIPAVKDAKLALRLFDTLGVPQDKIRLVLNRSEAHTEFNKDSIESHLKFPIAAQLPHDSRTLVNSINRGLPFVVTNPESEASQRMRELVSLLLPEGVGAEEPKSRGRRGFLGAARR